MNLFLYKETHFFAFIQFSSLFAQLCYLVAHPVGYAFPRELAMKHITVRFLSWLGSYYIGCQERFVKYSVI